MLTAAQLSGPSSAESSLQKNLEAEGLKQRLQFLARSGGVGRQVEAKTGAEGEESKARRGPGGQTREMADGMSSSLALRMQAGAT